MNTIFHAGGALSANHSAYVERRADHDALRAILDGEYIHVIAPRQVGKTSLLRRMAIRLIEMGWRCPYVDLATLIGFSKSDWYSELGKELTRSLTPGETLNLNNQLDLRRFLLDQALPWPESQPSILILLDEVEGVSKARDENGQPFSDTFFMMLRNLYNQRDDYDGTLVVALAGAVDPNNLVKDPDISPFNVGQEISLEDFTKTEAHTLTRHLENLEIPIETTTHEALYGWTNGHPYLSQRICAELERQVKDKYLVAISPEVVAAIVEQIILNPANPLQEDKNLKHVRKMLDKLSKPAESLWKRLQNGEVVSRREAVEEIFLELYLTGAVKVEEEQLLVRNQIYKQAFPNTGQSSALRRKASRPTENVSAMNSTFRVFVSSTWIDLQPERKAVEEALHRMKSTAFSGMEYFGSHPDRPRNVSLAEVEQSDIYVGIFAHRYGSGITEAEYRQAREKDIPCLIYFKDDSVPVVPTHIERDAAKLVKLEALKQEIKDNHTVSFFTDPNQLSTQVVTDLHNMLGIAPTKRGQPPQGSTYHIHISGGQGITIGDHNQVTQHFTNAQLPEGMPEASRLRLEHLADNIQQDLVLLKEYEDALRYADDPRRKARYRKEIQQLRESAMAHQQELDALQAQFSNVGPSEAIQAVASQIQALHGKLDALQSGQRSLSQQVDNLQDNILARFDVSEHTIIAAVIERLDRHQLTMTEDVLDAIDSHKLSDREMSDVLVILQQTLSVNRLNEQTLPDTAAADEIRRAAEIIDEPELDIAHKLKIGIPIIPFILSYEGEVAVRSGLNLEEAWQHLVARVRGE